MNFEPELMTAGMIDAAIYLTHRLDDDFGLPRKTVMSQRDVPFLSRAAIPALVRNGIDVLSVGVNGGSTPPNLPPAFLWRDVPSNTQVLVLLLQGGYGGIHLWKTAPFTPVMLPGFGEAAVVDWRGDNAGPPPEAADLIEDFSTLYQQFNGSYIVPSTFEEYAAAARTFYGVRRQDPTIGSHRWASSAGALTGFVPGTAESAPAVRWNVSLPVITSEVGDTWIYGVPSDPVKVARMRAAHRSRQACLSSGACSIDDPKLFNATAFLLKNSEHTWGLDHKTVLSPVDEVLHQNWSNAEFHAIARGLPPAEDPHQLTEKYRKLARSWTTQRDYGLTYALDALGEDHPLAEAIRAAWAEQVPSVPRHGSSPGHFVPGLDETYPRSTIAYLSHDHSRTGGGSVESARFYDLGSRWKVGVNQWTGAVCSLLDVATGTDYAGASGCSAGGSSNRSASLFAPQYMTLDALDYGLYELLYNYLWVVDFIVGDDFDDQTKQGIDKYNATAALHDTAFMGAWISNSSSDGNSLTGRSASATSKTTFRLDIKMSLPDDTVLLAGGFQSVWLTLAVEEEATGACAGSGVGCDFQQGTLPPNISVTLYGFNKTATRMPEALFLRINLAVGSDTSMGQHSDASLPSWIRGAGWCMEKLGSWMQSWPIPWGGSTRLHGVSDGGVAFLRPYATVNREDDGRLGGPDGQMIDTWRRVVDRARFNGSSAANGRPLAGEAEAEARLRSYTPSNGDKWLNGSLVAGSIQSFEADACHAALSQGALQEAVPVPAAGSFKVESLDAAVVSFGNPTTFAVPTNLPPDFEGGGSSFLLLSNAWGTNYVSVSLGQPMPQGGPQESDMKWRFKFVPLT